MNQNETIRINFDIDDRSLRNLNDTISSLERTLNDLSRTLSSTANEFSLLDAGSSIVNGTFDTLLRTLSISSMSLGNIDENLDILTGTQGLFSIATGASQVAMDKKTTSMWLAAGAAKGLSFAMKALPFVGLLTMALSLINILARLFRGTNDTSNATDELADRMEYLNDRMEESRKRHEERVQAINDDRRSTQELITRLRVLQGEESKSNGERVEAIRIARELNDRIDGLNFAYDKSTGLLDKNSLAVLGMADYYGRLAHAIETLEGNQIRLNEITAEFAEIDLELELLRKEYLELTEGVCDFGRALEINAEELEKVNERASELRADNFLVR